MALSPDRRSKRSPLHNFSFPDNGLQWGTIRVLPCSKTDPNIVHGLLSVPEPDLTRKISSFSPSSSLGNLKSSSDEIEAAREKIMLDLRVETDKLKISIDKSKEKGKEKELECGSDFVRPWNLRTRRAACKAPQVNASSGKGANGNLTSPPRPLQLQDSRLRGGWALLAEEKAERPKFSFTLTKEEIESDFLAMTGAKPPKRPIKRPKALQRKLNDLVPGLWLSEITTETYKVDDVPERRKGQK